MEIGKRRVEMVCLSHYSRKEIKKTIFEFCKKRETIPLYKDFYGKRPDILEYEEDIYELAKKGVTSFHCSQEIWKNPLEIKKEMSTSEINELREGWDFLIDIDAKYFDYAKITCLIIIKALKYFGIKNFGIKFSGSKGFHLIIPNKAFPEDFNGKKTKEMFPEWPRTMARYLQEEFIKKNLEKEIEKITEKKYEKEIFFIPKNEAAIEGLLCEHQCEKCKTKTIDLLEKNNKRRIFRCPVKSCNKIMQCIKKEQIYFSKDKKFNSYKNPELFKERIKLEEDINSVDLVLVSSRHLFRSPYSLHEKTALCSVVLDENEIKDFYPEKAHPFDVKIKKFYPDVEKEEAKRLLASALDWEKKKEEENYKTSYEKKEIDLSGIKIDESYFPPTIIKILEGMKMDGRKRALNILLSFFVSLKLPKEYIEEKIYDWNKRNYQPLKEGYIKSQIEWFSKNKRLPPNYDKPVYKEIGVLEETNNFKNPINFTIKKILQEKNKKGKINK